VQLSLAEPETSVAEQKLKEFVEENSAQVQSYQASIKSLKNRVGELEHRVIIYLLSFLKRK